MLHLKRPTRTNKKAKSLQAQDELGRSTEDWTSLNIAFSLSCFAQARRSAALAP